MLFYSKYKSNDDFLDKQWETITMLSADTIRFIENLILMINNMTFVNLTTPKHNYIGIHGFHFSDGKIVLH